MRVKALMILVLTILFCEGGSALAQPGAGPGGGGRGSGGFPGGGGGRGGRGVDQRPAGLGQSIDDVAEARFKRLDQNNDGNLNTDEMPGDLRARLARWDANRDGLIDLQEFKAYLRDGMRQSSNTSALDELANVPDPEEDRRPVVYTAKRLPKELPAWFKQLDLDNDGQVGLYEWRHAGWPVEQFVAMDRNNDGFLTVEEVLYSQALAQKSNKSGNTQIASFGTGAFAGNGFSGKGSFGGKGQFGKGGNGRFGGGQFARGTPSGGGDQPQMRRRQVRGGTPSGGDSTNGGFGRKGRRGGGNGVGE